MASLTPEGNSPTATSFGRKNKLGYTRISVACAHCRRRKIRCIRAEDDTEGRCANCIKLKKECIFTSVDTTGNDDTKGHSKVSLSSQTSSTMSHSPTGISPVHPDTLDYPQGTAGMYAEIPGVIPISGRASGIMMPSNVIPPEHLGIQRAGHPDWHAQPMDVVAPTYANTHSTMQWHQAPEHARPFPPLAYPRGNSSMPYTYMDQSRAESTRQTAWSAAEHTHTAAYRSPMTPISAYPQHHQQGLYAGAYDQHAPVMVTQAMAQSQYYTQRHGPPQPAGDGHYPWPNYHPDSAPPTSPRHDSMAANWSRGGSYSGHSYPASYDPPSARYAKGSTDSSSG
ncbi:hypothetical protein CAC42_6581 [Sphaceloma murrayae]|uniref:Zn(2)-C6 fungal-type domain-containing protein n=1 Tax=Sphaceloma murrayae TaxID=2082308 RepID=A0A2K1QFV6_9PEZI|nr:hypothetical protein CAC42_6581 [Sphaceloma murrayae]